MNSCVWAEVHLIAKGDEFQGALRNMNNGSLQKVFTTVRKQVPTSKGRIVWSNGSTGLCRKPMEVVYFP